MDLPTFLAPAVHHKKEIRAPRDYDTVCRRQGHATLCMQSIGVQVQDHSRHLSHLI
jgi:hypothetical protein